MGGAEGEAGCCAPDEDEVSGVDVVGRCACVCVRGMDGDGGGPID